ncbi:response regulator transcription factor [Flavobacterium sp. '19STA2R22 D10 B1']|uniref:response regulator transcription factor n=1 Tax=Flavobacterium aerium TaxID=3037261 RepID=UPI00278BCC64|nr:response regulator transcription factor [Flavobacterium sp. '19STA2R22 D10 B1']
MIRIVLADDEPLFRSGIAFLLQREENIEIVYEASNGEELMTYLEQEKELPDIIIMDIRMPILDGINATKMVGHMYPDIKVVVLTSYNTKSFIINMIDLGAASYLMKNATPQELITTIQTLSTKGFYYNDLVMEVIHEKSKHYNNAKKKSYFSEILTCREKEILKLICLQLNTNEMASKLFISMRTVEGHRNNLMLKTDSKNVAGLVVFALKNEIIVLDDL